MKLLFLGPKTILLDIEFSAQRCVELLLIAHPLAHACLGPSRDPEFFGPLGEFFAARPQLCLRMLERGVDLAGNWNRTWLGSLGQVPRRRFETFFESRDLQSEPVPLGDRSIALEFDALDLGFVVTNASGRP